MTGGVQIKNCTAVPVKIQLSRVDDIYYLLQPGERFERNTRAVHFTIVATVSDKNDTGRTETVLPNVDVVATSLAAMVTVPGDLVSGDAEVTEAGVVASGGALLTKELAAKLFREAKEEHCYINSAGWYFGGRNYLEIRGGPKIMASSKGFEYSGRSLKIVDTNYPKRHS